MIYIVDMWFKMVIGLLGILYMPGSKFIKYRNRGKTSQRNPLLEWQLHDIFESCTVSTFLSKILTFYLM